MTEMHQVVLPLRPMDIQIDIYFLLLGCFHCGLLTNTEMVFPVDQAKYHSRYYFEPTHFIFIAVVMSQTNLT